MYLHAYKNHKCYYSFSVQKISFLLEYKFVSMTLRNPEYLKGYRKLWTTTKCRRGNFSLSDRNNSFDTLGLIYAVFVHMNLGALGLPMSVWLCIHSSSVCSHLSCIGCTSFNLYKIAPETSSLMLLVLQDDKL